MWESAERDPGNAYPLQMVRAFPGAVRMPKAPSQTATPPSHTRHIPATYLWAQSRLWGLVHLQVLCSPASLRDHLFQLDQGYLEVLEALGKRTSPVSDTESPWKWECIKDEGSNRSLRGSILLEVLPHSSSSLP